MLSAVGGTVQLAAVQRGMEVERSFVPLKLLNVSLGEQRSDWKLLPWLTSIFSEGNVNK